MKESEKLGFTEEGNEVELSAQDLFALAPPVVPDDAQNRTEQDAVNAVDVTPAPHAVEAPRAADEPVRTPSQPATAQPASTARKLSARHIFFVLGVAAAAAAAVAMIGTTDTPAIQPPAQPPATEEATAEAAAAPADVEGSPVLFKNPFDDTEVFEFPPGTSREEARAAVADLLIMRARERMEHETFTTQR